ncbi:cytochrome b6 [Phtheirospermum japonicum]|uniref:Cytochrome b6 n=1 Tax=Phtheirospermum japonicum TaxID=374723 RepID=A0A830CDP6_9LAMI|nr:cytochrome b6 [Phtheirospermum japonicum]
MILHVFRVYLIGGIKKISWINLCYRCGSDSVDRIFWRNWLILTSGPNRLLGCESASYFINSIFI